MGRRKKGHLEHNDVEPRPAHRIALCGRRVHRRRLMEIRAYGDFVQVREEGHGCLDCDAEAKVILRRADSDRQDGSETPQGGE